MNKNIDEVNKELAKINKEIEELENTDRVIVDKSLEIKPVLKDSIKEVLKDIEDVTEEIDNIDRDEKIILENRIRELEEENKGKEVGKKTNKIRKKFRVPFAFKKLSKKASKSLEHVFVMYLSLKKEVSFKVCRIVAGDVIVIGNKVHEINPEAVWKMKKTMFYIVKEIDRKPVSNMDYDKIVARRDDTQADTPLLKAVFGATNKSSGIIKDKNILVWVVLGILAIGGLILFSGGAA